LNFPFTLSLPTGGVDNHSLPDLSTAAPRHFRASTPQLKPKPMSVAGVPIALAHRWLCRHPGFPLPAGLGTILA